MATIEIQGFTVNAAATAATLDCYNRSRVSEVFDLLPVGIMWPRATDTVLHKTVSGLALEFSRIDKRCEAMTREADPAQTLELLEGWERVCGLPDDCDRVLAPTIPERRADVLEVLAGDIDQTPAFYEALAASYGYAPPTITRNAPFFAGKNCTRTDPVCHKEAQISFTWTYATGADDQLLECKLRKYVPPYIELAIVFA